MSLVRVVAIVCCALWLAVPARAAEIAPDKEIAIRELFEVTNTMAMTEQVSRAMLPQFMAQIRKSAPNISQSDADKLSAVILEEFQKSTASLMKMMVALYDKNFTLEEIRAAIAFYKTPAGRSMIAKTPALMAQSMSLGMAWGNEVGRRAAEKAVQKGRALGMPI